MSLEENRCIASFMYVTRVSNWISTDDLFGSKFQSGKLVNEWGSGDAKRKLKIMTYIIHESIFQEAKNLITEVSFSLYRQNPHTNEDTFLGAFQTFPLSLVGELCRGSICGCKTLDFNNSRQIRVPTS